LTQAAGRAGRGDLAGKVVIQTYNPEEFSIVTAAKQNYVEYYNNEIAHRKLMGYPPTMVMTAVLITSKNDRMAMLASEKIKKEISGFSGIRIIGPSKAAISKINDVYRYVLYLKSPDYGNLTKATTYLQDNVINTDEYKGISIQFDFNPLANY
jgi:primosomal protein N' (replication factor Y)